MNAAPALLPEGREPRSPGTRRPRCGKLHPVTRSSIAGLEPGGGLRGSATTPSSWPSRSRSSRA